MDLVVLDIETTGFRPDKDEIIELAGVRFREGIAVDEFSTLVKPNQGVPHQISELTGIDKSMLIDAPSVEKALPDFLDFIGQSPVAGHNVRFDIQFLEANARRIGISSPKLENSLDSLAIARIILPKNSEYSLAALVKQLDITHEEQHRALADAKATGELLIKLQKIASRKWPTNLLSEICRLASFISPTVGAYFEEIRTLAENEKSFQAIRPLDQIQGLSFAVVTEDHTIQGSNSLLENNELTLPEKSAHLLSSEGPLPQMFSQFAAREAQMDMARMVADALDNGQHLMIEAGTGTGKSLAYLVPSALYAKSSEKKVVISTHTLALQDQIEHRDFPILKKMFPFPVQLAVLKGRTNYACLRKIRQESASLMMTSDSYEIQSFMMFMSWLVETERGLKDELSVAAASSGTWQRIQSESDSCIGKRCAFFKRCYYFQAKQSAQQADLVVTNHSLVFSDLKSDHRVLPSFDYLIMDEAHHVRDVATKHLGSEVHWLQFLGLSYRLSREGVRHSLLQDLRRKYTDSPQAERIIPSIERAEEHILSLRQVMERIFLLFSNLIPNESKELRLSDKIYRAPEWEEFLSLQKQLENRMVSLQEEKNSWQKWGEEDEDTDRGGRMLDALGYLEQLMAQCALLFKLPLLTETEVCWLEKNGTREKPLLSLHFAPLDVSDILCRELFQKKDSIVLTSATLTVNQSFDYAKRQLGLEKEEDLLTATLPSPFDLGQQARLCVPRNIPEMSKLSPEETAHWLGQALSRLAMASGGRMLALFTSHALLKATAARMRSSLKAANINILAQGVHGNRTQVLRAFKTHPRSVLLGAQSFWEGIDLPGDELTTVAMIRLPFAPPSHPITEMRHEQLKQEGINPFLEDSLPEAIVRFRQGFGRLIRTKDDRGVVVIYDKRILTARYGSSFLHALPGVRPLISDEETIYQEVQRFLQPTSDEETG
ncbi:helicase C-terminal domain-containing protein [Alicyclobacillus tolerans]|uniref:helicase C-terminal domain-containing protein n=1 Tax=Alicyclobacillus tolerans TaxID=90970 RepID=UPI003B7D9437